MTRLFIEQPLASPGSAQYFSLFFFNLFANAASVTSIHRARFLWLPILARQVPWRKGRLAGSEAPQNITGRLDERFGQDSLQQKVWSRDGFPQPFQLPLGCCDWWWGLQSATFIAVQCSAVQCSAVQCSCKVVLETKEIELNCSTLLCIEIFVLSFS